MIIILLIFLFESRGKGMGIFGFVMMFVLVVGLIFFGWIIEYYIWCIMFYGFVLIGVIVIIVVFFIFKNLVEL